MNILGLPIADEGFLGKLRKQRSFITASGWWLKGTYTPLTWNLNRSPVKGKVVWKEPLFRFHVSLGPLGAPEDRLLFRILEPLRAFYLGTWAARVCLAVCSKFRGSVALSIWMSNLEFIYMYVYILDDAGFLLSTLALVMEQASALCNCLRGNQLVADRSLTLRLNIAQKPFIMWLLGPKPRYYESLEP